MPSIDITPFLPILAVVASVFVPLGVLAADAVIQRLLPTELMAGTRTVIRVVMAATAAGGVFGVLIASLIGNWLIVVPAAAFLGSNFGLAVAFGVLPEAPADAPSEAE